MRKSVSHTVFSTRKIHNMHYACELGSTGMVAMLQDSLASYLSIL